MSRIIQQYKSFGIRNNFLGKAILSNSIFYFLLVIIIIFCSYMNYNADKMDGLVWRYHQIADFISSGFSKNSSIIQGDVTFPMWGYGLIFSLTKSKFLIIVFQQILTLLTILFIDLSIYSFKWSNHSRFLFRLSILLSFNWFFFHTSLWPYSISSNLLLLSLFLLLHFFYRNKFIYIILSGISFGLVVNFRSDYYYFAYFLFFVIIILRVFKKLNFKTIRFVFWIIIITIMLIPWGIYTYKITGHYLQTSTNGGHVIFISLGQFPNNNWGITQRDNDPKMRLLLKDKFGDSISSVEYKADVFLKKQWFESIRNDPGEYIKKACFNVFQVFRSPFYIGDIEKSNFTTNFTTKKHEMLRERIKNNLNHLELNKLLKLFFSSKNYILFFPLLINIWGILIFSMYIYFQIRFLLRKKLSVFSDPVAIIFSTIIFYQLALIIFTYFMPSYNSNTYIIYVILIIYCQSEIRKPITQNILAT